MYLVPSSGIWVHVQYPGDYSINVPLLDNSSLPITNSGEKFYQVSERHWPQTGISNVLVQSMSGSGGILIIEVYNNGQLIKRGTTTAPGTVEMYTAVPTTCPTYTDAPTPIRTPSFGTIVIQSSPATANIYLDNLVKGVTPLTINNVPNGAHVVLLRLYGYQDSSSTINVLGDTQTINPTLIPINTATTGATTTIPTTASVTTTTTTGAITTQLTTTITTLAPTPTATVNYSATIAAMQSQIAEQNVKIAEQGNILNQIMNFLRNVFGLK